MKPIIGIILFNLIFLPFSGQAQVGLLSSNNKAAHLRHNQDSSKFQHLFSTDEIGPYSLVGSTDSLKPKFGEINVDSLAILKGMIDRANQSIEKLQSRSKEVKTKIDSLSSANNKIDRNRIELEGLKEKFDSASKEIEYTKKREMELVEQSTRLSQRLEFSHSLNKLLISEVINKRAEQMNQTLSSLKKVSETSMKALYKNKYIINSNWFLIDSTKETLNKAHFLDTLANLYSDISMLADAGSENSNTLNQLFGSLKETRDFSNNFTMEDATYFNKVDEKWQKLTRDTVDIAASIKKTRRQLDSVVTIFNATIDRNIKDKAPNKEERITDFGAFPLVTSILGKKEVIPQLQLYGSYNFENSQKSFEANMGLSIAPTSTPDTSNLYNIFTPTTSKFLIHSNFTWSFLPVGTSNSDSAKKVGLRLDVSFASKNLVYDTFKTIKSVSSSILYAKMGAEIGVLPKRLSLYGNLNTATILDKNEEFKTGTGLNKNIFVYFDCGVKLFLDPTPASKVKNDLYIFSNLNFIINSGDVKRVTKSNDLVIPSLQVGIVKNLGRF